MRKRNFLLLSSVAVLILGGPILTDPAAYARQAKRSNLKVRWEYCVISTGTVYFKENLSQPRKYVDITYYQATGYRVEKLYADAKAQEPEKEILVKAIAKLGNDGWEMFMKEPSGDPNYLVFYFKRRKS